MKQFFETIPDELIDSAKLDGASIVQTSWRVVLPITRPGIIALEIPSLARAGTC